MIRLDAFEQNKEETSVCLCLKQVYVRRLIKACAMMHKINIESLVLVFCYLKIFINNLINYYNNFGFFLLLTVIHYWFKWYQILQFTRTNNNLFDNYYACLIFILINALVWTISRPDNKKHISPLNLTY